MELEVLEQVVASPPPPRAGGGRAGGAGTAITPLRFTATTAAMAPRTGTVGCGKTPAVGAPRQTVAPSIAGPADGIAGVRASGPVGRTTGVAGAKSKGEMGALTIFGVGDLVWRAQRLEHTERRNELS